MPQKLERKLFVGTTVMFFLVVNYVKLVSYYFLGQLHLRNLLAALVLLPLAPVGVYIGLWMQGRITDRLVYRWANILLFATGWKLIWDREANASRLYSLAGDPDERDDRAAAEPAVLADLRRQLLDAIDRELAIPP